MILSLTYQKETQRNTRVQKSRIVAESLEQNANQNANVDHDEFVAGIGDQVERVHRCREITNVQCYRVDNQLKDSVRQRTRRQNSQLLRNELVLHSHDKTGQNDVCDVRHRRNIQIWCIQIVSWLNRIIVIVSNRPVLN